MKRFTKLVIHIAKIAMETFGPKAGVKTKIKNNLMASLCLAPIKDDFILWIVT